MSTSLPERPDLGQMRRQAKELRDAARRGDPVAAERLARHHRSDPDGVSLAVAQLVIARELGFSSWPQLKAAVDAANMAPVDLADRFVAASIEGRPKEATRLLAAEPGIAGRSVQAAAVLGDTDALRAVLAAHPEAALTIDEERGWPPLLYACYSRWHQIDPDRAARLADVIRLLLAVGASPHTNNGAFRNGYRSALAGTVEVNNPHAVRVLLDRGANPDDGRCIEVAAGRGDAACLELLLAAGARVAGTWALGAAVYADNPRAVALVTEAVRATNAEAAAAAAAEATRGLADAAAANVSSEVVAVLLAAGADPNVRDSDAGLSALRGAVRAGNQDTVALLVDHGALDDRSDIDELMGACRRADRALARRLLAEHPDWPEHFGPDDRSAMVDAAGSASPAAVEVMLECGFSLHDRNQFGEQPLHSAAYLGNAAVVRLLLDAGADVDGRDHHFEATPLAYATVGSGEQAGKPGEWIETVRLLLDGGASRQGVWVSDKPPSEEVIEVLRRYGITADDDEPGEHEPIQVDRPGSIGHGVMTDIARHLEAAHRDRDLDLLESLLHPDVRWSGLCQNKAQVIDWYRTLLAEGTVAAVESVEVDREAVVLGLTVARSADGARPAPGQQVCQVFTVHGAQIVDIRGYPDRHSALTRP